MSSERLLVLLLAGLSIILTSCYSDYVFLSYDTYHGACWDSSHTRVAFISSAVAYRKAKGISAFPDGGIPDYLFEDVALYLFEPGNRQLTRLLGFNDLAGLMRNRWSADLALTDSVICYRIEPVSAWELYLGWAKSKKDSSRIYALKDKYSKIYTVRIRDKHVAETEPEVFPGACNENREAHKADLTRLNGLLSEIPVAQWGLNLRDLYPKSDREYIEDFIYVARGGSALTKRAIVEQVISSRSDREIREILNRMDEYKNSLEGLERTEYEIYSAEACKLIRELL